MWNFMFAHKNGPAAIIISADSEEEAIAYLTDELGLPASAFRMEREEEEWDKPISQVDADDEVGDTEQ